MFLATHVGSFYALLLKESINVDARLPQMLRSPRASCRPSATGHRPASGSFLKNTKDKTGEMPVCACPCSQNGSQLHSMFYALFLTHGIPATSPRMIKSTNCQKHWQSKLPSHGDQLSCCPDESTPINTSAAVHSLPLVYEALP